MQQVLTDSFASYAATAMKADIANLRVVIGMGNPSWDDTGLPDVSPSTDELLSPVAINPVERIDFLDAEGNVSPTPTSTLRIDSRSFTAEDFEGSVRECGLYRIDGNYEAMILYSVFSRIDITPQITLTKSLIIRLGQPGE